MNLFTTKLALVSSFVVLAALTGCSATTAQAPVMPYDHSIPGEQELVYTAPRTFEVQQTELKQRFATDKLTAECDYNVRETSTRNLIDIQLTEQCSMKRGTVGIDPLREANREFRPANSTLLSNR